MKAKKVKTYYPAANADMDKLIKDARISTNMVFVLADVLEQALIDTNEDLRKIGMELIHKDKMLFNRCLNAAKELRDSVSNTFMKNQIMFGDSSDYIYQMIKNEVMNYRSGNEQEIDTTLFEEPCV